MLNLLRYFFLSIKQVTYYDKFSECNFIIIYRNDKYSITSVRYIREGKHLITKFPLYFTSE